MVLVEVKREALVMGHPVWRGPPITKRRHTKEAGTLPKLSGSRSVPVITSVDVHDDWRESRPGPLQSIDYPNWAERLPTGTSVGEMAEREHEERRIREAIRSSRPALSDELKPGADNESFIVREKLLPKLEADGRSSDGSESGRDGTSLQPWYSYAPPAASDTPLKLSSAAVLQERTAMFVRVRRVWRASYLGRERFRKAFVRHRLATAMLKYSRRLVEDTKGQEDAELAEMGHVAEDETTRKQSLLSLVCAGGLSPRVGPELNALQPDGWGKPLSNGKLSSFYGEDAEDQVGWKSPWRQPAHPSHSKPMRHPGEAPDARAARRAAESRHDVLLAEWERMVAVSTPLTKDGLSQTSRRCKQAAGRMQLKPTKDWNAPLPMRQSLAEAAQRFEEVHKATTSEASKAFDEVIASEGASSAQAFAAKLEAVRRNRLGFIHTYKSLRQPQNKESLRLLGPLDSDDLRARRSEKPPTVPSELQIVGSTQHACHIEWKWEEEGQVRWVAYNEVGRNSSGKVLDAKQRDQGGGHGPASLRRHSSHSKGGGGSRRKLVGHNTSGRNLLSVIPAARASEGSGSGSGHGSGRGHGHGSGRGHGHGHVAPMGTRVKESTAGHGGAGHGSGGGGGHYEASCVFLIEGCYLSPAYGALLPWRRLHTPTRRLDAVVRFPAISDWEDHHLIAGQAPRADAEGVHRIEGPLNDLAIRIRAVHNGGCSIASKVVVVRPPHTIRQLTLEVPPSLPAKARQVLGIEDLLRSTSRIHGGMSPDVQYYHVQEQLLCFLPVITQTFRLFALTFSCKPSTIYSLSRAQFRGMLVALRISPGLFSLQEIPIIFAKAKKALREEAAARELEEDGDGAETRGYRDLNGLGVTQFVGAMLRVAHACYPELHEEGVGAQLEMMMHEKVLPAFHEIARV